MRKLFFSMLGTFALLGSSIANAQLVEDFENFNTTTTSTEEFFRGEPDAFTFGIQDPVDNNFPGADGGYYSLTADDVGYEPGVDSQHLGIGHHTPLIVKTFVSGGV